MQVNIRKINAAAKLPTYAHSSDAGMDVCSVKELVLEPLQRALVPTGLVFELPPNTEAQVRPRSGLALKHGITVLNTPGTIDSGYRGEVGVILINLGSEPFKVEVGMKIAQIVFAQVTQATITEVASVADSDRGAGGFGSTGL